MFQAKHPAGHRCQNDELQQETKHRRLDEIHRFPAYEQEQDETSNGIQAQYVAPPDEEIVTQAEQEKPGESATQRRNRSTRSEEHTSEPQSLMRNSYAVFCLKKKITYNKINRFKRHAKAEEKHKSTNR